MIRRLAFLAALLGTGALAAPAWAQHEGHGAPEPVATSPTADPHAGHAAPAADAEPDDQTDHSQMDHSAMNHGDMDHEAEGGLQVASPGPDMETPPPPEAGSGPPRAADAIFGAEAMRASREDLQRSHGEFPVFWFQADRFETQLRRGDDGYLWDVQGYYGGPSRKLWFKTEGEGNFGEPIDKVELQGLYSVAVSPFWDLQAGLRQDFGPVDTTYAVVGLQGLAPYLVDIDAALFLSHRGDLTARVEAELDQRITQSLILQPRAELALSAQDVPQLGIGAGVDKIEIGVRLRYEIVREFAPYIGVDQSWRLGGSADYARLRGEDPGTTSVVVGIRFWF